MAICHGGLPRAWKIHSLFFLLVAFSFRCSLSTVEHTDHRTPLSEPSSPFPPFCSTCSMRIAFKGSTGMARRRSYSVPPEFFNKASETDSAFNSGVRKAFQVFDADFFNDTETQDLLASARTFNLPIARANRKLVGEENGGLRNPSPLIFNPNPTHFPAKTPTKKFKFPTLSSISRPSSDEDIAYMSILELGALIKAKQISSQELTQIFLRRLKRYGPILECVITYTEELAYEQAKLADDALSKGIYLGPLHGVPYGLKDIIAVPGYKTTWGSSTFKDQEVNMEASVYQKLKAAGAVLVAKLVTGSLAYDDIWFGGRTRNPWNIEEFSTGSSAGPAASTAAGLVPFAIGSETAGSITYPSARCGITAYRPTFGTVGRTGVMSISESLDKLGPFCRTAADCAVIIDVIRGKDFGDWSSRDVPLDDPFSVNLSTLTVGFTNDSDKEVVEVLKARGVHMVPFELTYAREAVQGVLNVTMDVDMLAHFDAWQRDKEDASYEAQDQWPTELRRARLISAVDYIQAQRVRGMLVREVSTTFTVDAFIANATDWDRVCVGNLVGFSVVVIPTGFKNISNMPTEGSRRRTAVTTGIHARADQDHIALALAIAYQSATNHHRLRPPINDLGPYDVVPSSPEIIIPPRRLIGNL